jgi:hypothetical protein
MFARVPTLPKAIRMRADRFVVEVNRKVVGIAVRVPGGFQFFASDEGARELDTFVFSRAKTLIKKVTAWMERTTS